MDEIRERWASTDFEPADVRVFHSRTVHRALPNRSDRVRLSLDTRCQPVDAPRPWQFTHSMAELRRYYSEVKRLVTEAGGDDLTYRDVVIEMMRRGEEPDRSGAPRTMESLTSSKG